MSPTPHPDAAGRRNLLLPLALLVAVIVALTAGNVYHTVSHLEESEEVQLQAIADLKANQVADWVHERRGDAQILSSNLYLSELYRLWRDQDDTASRDRLLQRLEDYRRAYDYSEALIFEASGEQVWPMTDPETPPRRNCSPRFVRPIPRPRFTNSVHTAPRAVASCSTTSSPCPRSRVAPVQSSSCARTPPGCFSPCSSPGHRAPPPARFCCFVSMGVRCRSSTRPGFDPARHSGCARP